MAATREHIRALAPHIREVDQRESAAAGSTPLKSLHLGLRLSRFCLTAKVGGHPVAMLGVTPHPTDPRAGIPWLLGTDEVYRHGREMVRLGPQIVDRMHSIFPILQNFVWVENVRAITLLRGLGFTIAETVEVGGLSLARFYREAEHV